MNLKIFTLLCLAIAIANAQDETLNTEKFVGPTEEDQETTWPNPENTAKVQEVCALTGTDLNTLFYKEYLEYLRKFNKAYACTDFVSRYKLYLGRRAEVDRHNAIPNVSYLQAINYFSDLTEEERLARFLGVESEDRDQRPVTVIENGNDNDADADEFNLQQNENQEGFTTNVLNTDIFRKFIINFDFICCTFNPFGVPCKKDWQSLGKVTSVKNQGNCGSCWAFAAIAATESAYLINYNNGLNLSEQELVSCATASWGNFGCSGGWPHKALDYIIQKRIHREIIYPYTATNGVCNSFPNVYKYPVKSRVIVLPQNRMDIFLQNLNKRPISVAFKVTGSFFNYSSGIYNPIFDAGCSTPGINHAVLAVGYSLGCNPFIRFKNSWGTGWGEAGYFRMKISKNIFQNGPCNLINHPYNVYPNV
jgi:hypothetical protein